MNSRQVLSSTRRSFIRRFVILSAASLSGAPHWTARLLAGITDGQGAEGGLLRLRISDFPPLQKAYGSVRVGTSAIGTDHRPVGLFYPVIVNRAPGNVFYGLDSACSHEGCTVPTFDSETQLIQCLCHGSQYKIDGSLERGPAGFGLRQFNARFDGTDLLTIEIPDVSFFSADPVRVEPNQGRVHLQFLGFEHINYDVRFRPNLGTDWSGPVPFSLTDNGALDQLSVFGQANFIDVYLDRNTPQGLYAIAMKTQLV